MTHRRRAPFLLAAALSLGTAGAQDLGAYTALTTSLEQAVAARPAGAAATLPHLYGAQDAYEQLAPTLDDSSLRRDLETSLTAARATLTRSETELQAQVALTRGLLRKALYEQTMTQLAEGTLPPPQLRLLAEEYGLSAPQQAALQQRSQADPGGVARALQAAAVRKSAAYLDRAEKAASRPAAYLELAQAMAWYTPLQDTVSATPGTLQQFSSALGAAAQGQAKPDLTALRLELRRFGAALSEEAAPAKAPASGVAAKPPAAVAASAPSAVPAATAAAEAAPAVEAGPDATAPDLAALDATYQALARALAANVISDWQGQTQALAAAQQSLGQWPQSLSSNQDAQEFQASLRRVQNRSGLRPPT
ncbi:hypothetical protein ACFP81_07890 [Deinococcus lacus]|uniref:DUF5667 domain-containing protein n=1 Tax=Deinococcus lacus TaxID=392561 RepID=A0ABW1YGE7_9DEIO